jgi:hypothetical protein
MIAACQRCHEEKIHGIKPQQKSSDPVPEIETPEQQDPLTEEQPAARFDAIFKLLAKCDDEN